MPCHGDSIHTDFMPPQGTESESATGMLPQLYNKSLLYSFACVNISGIICLEDTFFFSYMLTLVNSKSCLIL